MGKSLTETLKVSAVLSKSVLLSALSLISRSLVIASILLTPEEILVS